MNTRFSRLLCLSILCVLSVASGFLYAQQELPATGTETELLAVLESDAGLFEKAKACQQLAVTGTKSAVPVLAKLLADEQLSHYARFALQPNPDPSVDEALRASLTTLQGGPLVGVINSIGMRCDAGAVEALTGLLTHADGAVASAAACALGRIATPAAIETLRKTLVAGEPLRIAVADGCLTAADTLEKAQNLAGAMAIYDAMRQAELPKYLQIAALAGAIRSRGEQGVDLLVEQIQSPDKEFFDVGLSMAHLVPGQQVTDALLAELAKPTEQPTGPTKVLTILKAEYGANNTWVDVTEQVVGAMAENGVSVHSGNELTGTDPVPGVVKTLRIAYTLGDEKKEATVKEGDPLQVEGTVSRDPRLASIVAVLGERGDRSALPAIVKLVQAGPWDARMAAIRALAQVGDVSALPVLLEVAVQGQGSLSAAAIESLANLPDEKANVELLTQLDKSEGALRTALLQLVGRREIAAAAPTLLKLAADNDKATRDAAFASLGLVVRQEDLPALLKFLVKPSSPDSASAAKVALTRACQRMPDRDAAAKVLTEQMTGASKATQADLLDLLGDLGGALALQRVVAAAKSNDEQLQDAATRVLGRWMSPDAAPLLQDLVKTGNSKFKVRTLRGYIRIARQLNVPTEQRIEMCKTALTLADRDEDRTLVLETLARYPSPVSLATVAGFIHNAALGEAACASAVAIGEKLAGDQPEAVAKVMSDVVQTTKNAELKQKAQALGGK